MLWTGVPRDSEQLAAMLNSVQRQLEYQNRMLREEPDNPWHERFIDDLAVELEQLRELGEKPKYQPIPLVYVDELRDYGDMVKGKARRYGTKWCHLSCSGDCDGLHRFAARLGLRKEYAQHMELPDHYWHHYDLVPSKRELALEKGAVFKPIRQQAAEFNARRNAQKALAEKDTSVVE